LLSASFSFAGILKAELSNWEKPGKDEYMNSARPVRLILKYCSIKRIKMAVKIGKVFKSHI